MSTGSKAIARTDTDRQTDRHDESITSKMMVGKLNLPMIPQPRPSGVLLIR